MRPEEFRDIREKLELKQKDLADIFGLSGYAPISHYESGFRKPSVLIVAMMRLFNRLPEKDSLELRELIKKEVSRERKTKSPKK